MAFSFTLNGIRSETLGIKVNNVRRNVLPPVENRTIKITGLDGVYYYRSQFSESQIEVDITVIDNSLSDLVDKFSYISYFLNPQRGLMNLIFDDDLDRVYKVIVSGETNVDQVKSIGKTTIVFLVPKAFSESVDGVTQELTVMPDVNFARSSNAYRSNGNYVTANVGRGEYIDEDNSVYGVMIEENTINYLANNESNFESADSLGITVIGSASQSAKPYYAHVGSYSLEVKTQGVAAGEGVKNITKYPITASVPYTFSAYICSKSPASLKLMIEEYNSSDVVVTTSYSNPITITPEITKYSFTVTTNAATAKASVGIVTSSKQFTLFYTDAWQLERKAYSTSWTNQYSREKEFVTISLADSYNIINGTSGTIDFFYKKVTTPSNFAPIFDYGQYTSDNSKSRLVVFHNPTLGADWQKKLTFQIVNGATATSASFSLTLDNPILEGSLNYICVRWKLTGDALGVMKIDHVDMATRVHKSNTLQTTIAPATTFATNVITLGSNTTLDNTNEFFINGILGDFRISNYMRSDEDILNSALSFKPLVKDSLTSAKYSLNVTFRGTNISNIGTAPAYPVFTCIITTGGITSYSITVWPENKKIKINDSFSIGDILIIDCAKRLVTKNGSNINTLIDLTSQFPSITGDHQIVYDTTANVTVTYTPNWL